MKVNKNKVFEYLDALRDSGITNMYGSPAYVHAAFDVTQGEAVKLVTEWMQTFSERHPKEKN